MLATVIGGFRLGTFSFTPGEMTGWKEGPEGSNSSLVFVWVMFLVILDSSRLALSP
jgi:hypothetical protein